MIAPTLSSITWLIFKNWWWFFLSPLLCFIFKSLYLWWLRWEVWCKEKKWILIEIKPPKEILKPFKAMEDIFTVLWGLYDSPNWRERWCEGTIPVGPNWVSFEIASFGGEIHFFWRILKNQKDRIESLIYSHYPEAEISVVDDYTQKVPQDIPNKEWDLSGEDYSFFKKEDPFPIKTYQAFFEERAEIPEEKRIDPLNSLLEALSKLQAGEQFWFQIVITPITNSEIPWRTRGREIADKMARRPVKKPSTSAFGQAMELLIFGKEPEEKAVEKELIPPEMKLTPGERETLTAVENKIKKHGFKTWIRAVYLYKIKGPRSDGNLIAISRDYFHHFKNEDINTLVFWGPTRSKIHYFMKGRRLYLRKRKQFRNYMERMPSTFPWSLEGKFPFPHLYSILPYPKGPGIRGTIVLNTEELATIYHFPAKITVPTFPYVEAKKGGPPPFLPTE